MRPTVEVPSDLLLSAYRALKANVPGYDASRLEPYIALIEKPQFHIDAKCWFSSTNSGTYHSVTIYKNGEPLKTIGPRNGHGMLFLQTALDWLAQNGHIVGGTYGDHQSTRYLREVLHSTYHVEDVPRKKDLHNGGRETP